MDNSIFKGTLQLKILRTWIKIRANSLSNLSKHHERNKNQKKVPLKSSLLKKYDHELQRTLHQSR